ncbi:AraC family transcriptional regulator [Dyadobacter jiangsuensis]|uniref:AraC-like DNA-binding protein n=1 Tax=Dyadobacter jiangsuensis TaxID=1591085 RepID=A0A2P8FNB1_9BACT|nr:helix-turn-helix domain-containing protein [Dyadobacter jiangsuensis]PSL23199.1 AraC-like DNA-binding protein [Dyadobacter jiangsuensis]
MKYHQIQPPPHLQDYVRYYWALESSGRPDEQVHFVTIADGSPGIIFQQAPGAFFQEGKELSSVFLYGQSTAHTRIVSPATFSTIGVYFYPHALKSIFGIDSNELTDDCLDLDLFLNGKQLMERLENAADVKAKAHILSECLWEQICRNDHMLQSATRYALQRIIQSQGGVSMKDLRLELQVSERTLERRFQEGIGLSPMLFARICRFQASLNQLRSQSYDKLSDIAFEQEYADQSHFIRNFKEFTGLTPFQFRKRIQETVENFPVLVQS